MALPLELGRSRSPVLQVASLACCVVEIALCQVLEFLQWQLRE
jgi:hypothetical protein